MSEPAPTGPPSGASGGAAPPAAPSAAAPPAGATGRPAPARRPSPPRRAADAVVARWRRIPPAWRFALALFAGSKLTLTVVGIVTIAAFDEIVGSPPPQDAQMRDQQREISPWRAVNLWFAYDSFIYLRMVRTPVDSGWDEFAFPLLYPFLAKPLAALLGGDLPAAAAALLVVSNVAFLGALYYAYRLAEQLLGDAAAARRFTGYLVALPTAFLFHAALTEALFVCLALAAFHYAEQGRWLVAGVVGFLLATSRSVGFLVAAPLALVLLHQGGYRLGPRALWGYLRRGWPLLLVPAGWLAFMAFCRVLGGDWFAYQRAQERGWGIVVQSPLRTLRDGLTVAPTRDAVRVWFVLALLAVLVAGLRHLRPAYAAFAVLMVAMPLSIGVPVYKSLLRYLLPAMVPACLVLARWGARPGVGAVLAAVLALVQGALFALWLAYWSHFII